MKKEEDDIQTIEEQQRELNKLKLQVESLTNERDYILVNFRCARNKISDIEGSKGYRILVFLRKIIRKILRRG